MTDTRFVPDWPLSDLRPADYNPRRITESAFVKLQESLRRFGVVKPIILNRDGTIVAGHQRTKAMKAIGMESTPAVVLGIKAKRQDEIRFNLMHNTVETETSSGRVLGELPLGYSWVDWKQIEVKGGNAGGQIVRQIAQLLSRYGTWGSAVISEDGTIIANCDYALACANMRQSLLVYRMRDSEVPGFVAALGVDYGEYYFEPLQVKGYNQMHAQLNRLRGARDENGDLIKGSKDIRSSIYTKMVEPLLSALEPEKPRLVDFGAGHGDHARELKARGYPAFTYEPHLRMKGEWALDVRGIVQSVRELGRDVERHGLFPIVVLDSVLNSVIDTTFEDAVLVSVNALCAADGVVFTNARGLEPAQSMMAARYDAGISKPGGAVEFFDEHNFSARYRDGKWTLQHFHGLEEFKALCGRYFEQVRHVDSDNYHRVELRRPRPLGEDRYRWALNLELNMELPGGRYHNRHEATREAIVKAAVARDQATSQP